MLHGVWIFYVAAGVFAVAWAVAVVRQRRRFRNAVLLGFTVLCLGLGLLGESSRLGPAALDMFIFAVLAVPALTVLLLSGFLLANGATMIRREGRRPANLLSLLAGVGGLVILGLPLAAQYTQGKLLGTVALVLLLLTCYFGFLFCSYLAYAVVYGHLTPRAGAQFIIVLGSGLIKGKVPPLLAARLDRAIEVWREQCGPDSAPMLITSGGQGPDEPVAEADAMADYLLAHGVPEDRVLREDKSRTTRQNLENSKAIIDQRNPGSRCVVVTNNYHVFRAALTARQVRLNGQVIGAPTARYFWPSATIREFVAILADHPWVNLGIGVLLTWFGIAVGME